MKRFSLSFAAAVLFSILAASSLQAKTQEFRSGTILAAELSTQKPPFAFEEPLRYPADFSQRTYAAVVVTLDKGRKLSIYDYVLEAFGSRFPCVAIRVGSDPVDMRITDVKRPSTFIRYTLIFAVDASLTGNHERCRFRLVPAAPPASSAVVVNFNWRGRAGFTPPAGISSKGILKETL